MHPEKRMVNIAVMDAINRRNLRPASSYLCCVCGNTAWGYRTLNIAYDIYEIQVAPMCRKCLQKSIPLSMQEVNMQDNGKKRNISSEYRKLSMKYNTIPEDLQLAELWDCTLDSVKSARRGASGNGFAYARLPNKGGWKVIERPVLKPVIATEAIQSVLTSAPIDDSFRLVSSSVNGVNHIDFAPGPKDEIDAIRNEFAHQNVVIEQSVERLEARINALTQIMAEVMQIMRKTWE